MSTTSSLNVTENINDINRHIFLFNGMMDFTEVDIGDEIINDTNVNETNDDEDQLIKTLDNVKDDYLRQIYNESNNESNNENNHDFNISTIEMLFTDHPIYIRRVLILHFIIMYHRYSHLEFYLELLNRNHGIVGVNLIVNFPIETNIQDSIECYSNPLEIDSIPQTKRENMFNSLLVASLWSKNRDVIRLLYSYGADIGSRDLHGYYADELTERIFYFDHLISYNSRRYNIRNLYFAKRHIEDFEEVNEEIQLIAGELSPPENMNNSWQRPIVIT